MVASTVVDRVRARLDTELGPAGRSRVRVSERSQPLPLLAGERLLRQAHVVGSSAAGRPTLELVLELPEGVRLAEAARDPSTWEHGCRAARAAVPLSLSWTLVLEESGSPEHRGMPARLGELRLGEALVFTKESGTAMSAASSRPSLVNEVLDLVERCCQPRLEGWRADLEEQLGRLLVEPFSDGQVLTATYLNALENRLREMDQRLAELEEKGPEPSRSSGRPFIT